MQRVEYWSREKRNPMRDQETLGDAIADTHPGPEDLAVLRELFDQAWQQMDDLQREVLVLRLVPGCSCAEAARQVGRSVRLIQACWKSIVALFQRIGQ